MASLTIRQLDDEIKQKLRLQAAHNGRSMEAEARVIFTELFSDQNKQSRKGIASCIREAVGQYTLTDDEEIALPNRKKKSSDRKSLDFSDKDFG